VDDGSTDNTCELLEIWKNENNPFPMRYFYQENGGKHRAINRGLELARGELFFTVDSDDYLTEDAVEKVLRWDKELPKGERFCGFAGNLGTASVVTPNRIFHGAFQEGTALDRYGIVNGERAMIFYTDLHRKYLYPEFPGEKFMTEAVTWNRMANDGYKMRFYNDIIWVYEYREDGLTKAGTSIFLRNPRGYGLVLQEKAQFLKWSKWKIFKMWYTFTCDLSHLYPSRAIAGYIGAPVPVICVLGFLHRMIRFIKSSNSKGD
jgi:glycosyltransferase involved in cell wall biosynthesis